MVVFGPVLESMKFRLVEGQALLDPSRRLRDSDLWWELGAEGRSWLWL